MKAHQEDPKQERKAKKDIMNVQKFQMNYVSRCCALFFKIAGNVWVYISGLFVETLNYT